MDRRSFLSLAAAPLAQAQAQARPNIVLILADDLGYGDLGCYGQTRLQTPNIDRLAQDGVRLTQAYAGSTVCAPSRCALMTGLHTGHCFIRGNARVPLRPQDRTLAEVLKGAGYRTGLFGKWGLGNAGTTGVPTKQGFDEFFGYLDQQHAHNYYPDHLWHNESEVLLPKNWGNMKGTYSADLIAERALAFLRQPGPQPFFLAFTTTLPHANNEAIQYAPHGMEVPSDGPYAGRDWPPVERAFAAMVGRLDDSVGQLMAELRRSGQDRNTLVLFSSDNGPHREGNHDPAFFQSSGLLRGIKRDLTDGGIRVPFLARWPGRIRPGSTSEQVLAFWDLLPTLAEVARAEVPANLDGASFASSLLGGSVQPHRPLYWEFHERGFLQGVRDGQWKGIRANRTGPLVLYDVQKDIGEANNVAAQHPDVVARLTRFLDTARTDSAEFPIKPA